LLPIPIKIGIPIAVPDFYPFHSGVPAPGNKEVETDIREARRETVTINI
jgi:hypothetical protein